MRGLPHGAAGGFADPRRGAGGAGVIFKGVEICCPQCRGDLRETSGRDLRCVACGRGFPVVLGIPDLRIFSDPYIGAEADRAKGMQVAGRFEQLGFADLVAFYYSLTSVVPPRDARRYTRGLMAAVPRAEVALAAWEEAVKGNGGSVPTR